MFKNMEPMDSEDRAIATTIVIVAILLTTVILGSIFLLQRSNNQRLPAKRDEIAVVQREVDACKALSTDSAITLCLSQVPTP